MLIAGPEDAETSFFMLHGAGHSAMTFALVARYMAAHARVRVVAYDMRAHGYTAAADERDLSSATLVADALAVADAVFARTQRVVVVGHSMGGAIAVRAALRAAGHFCLAGIVVVDVVEGTALAALPAMNRVIDSTPAAFADIAAAVADADTVVRIVGAEPRADGTVLVIVVVEARRVEAVVDRIQQCITERPE